VRELRRAWLLPKFSKSDGSRRQRDPRPQRPQQPERQHRRRRLFQWWRAIRAEVSQLARAGFVVAQHAHHTPFFKCIAHGLDQLFGLLVSARPAGLRALSFIQHFLYVCGAVSAEDRKSTRLNSSHLVISYAVFCLKKHDQRPLSPESWQALRALQEAAEAWRHLDASVRLEVRQLLGQYVTYLMGRKPRLLPYLGS